MFLRCWQYADHVRTRLYNFVYTNSFGRHLDPFLSMSA